MLSDGWWLIFQEYEDYDDYEEEGYEQVECGEEEDEYEEEKEEPKPTKEELKYLELRQKLKESIRKRTKKEASGSQEMKKDKWVMITCGSLEYTFVFLVLWSEVTVLPCLFFLTRLLLFF